MSGIRDLPFPLTHAPPITYLVNGRQRITIAAGRALLTFGLEQAVSR